MSESTCTRRSSGNFSTHASSIINFTSFPTISTLYNGIDPFKITAMPNRDSSTAPSEFEAHSQPPVKSARLCPATQSNPNQETPETCPQHGLVNLYLAL